MKKSEKNEMKKNEKKKRGMRRKMKMKMTMMKKKGDSNLQVLSLFFLFVCQPLVIQQQEEVVTYNY